MLRDLSAIKEFILSGERIGEILQLPCETWILIDGIVNNENLHVLDYKVVYRGEVECSSKDLNDPFDFTLRYFEYTRVPRFFKVLRTTSLISMIIRRILTSRMFTELPPPVIGWKSDPGLRGAVKAKIVLYGKEYEVHSSLIMYKQIYASIFEKIFYFARNVRIEPTENAYTGRHLVEFTQVDVEQAFTTPEDSMDTAETLLKEVIREFLNQQEDLIERNRAEWLEKTFLSGRFPRISYEEACDFLIRKGFKVRKGKELSHEAEVYLGKVFEQPVWLTSFPSESRGFYYLEDPSRPGYNVDWNLITTDGEILDGGCREYHAEKIVKKIEASGENPADYKWFLELVSKKLVKPTCGWGLGLERFVKIINGLEHIAFATAHPRIPGLLGP
ncbi:MAG: asparagine synthetase A [Thermosphaera sp.]